MMIEDVASQLFLPIISDGLDAIDGWQKLVISFSLTNSKKQLAVAMASDKALCVLINGLLNNISYKSHNFK